LLDSLLQEKRLFHEIEIIKIFYENKPILKVTRPEKITE